MGRRGPLVTLLVGLAVGAALLLLSVNANQDEQQRAGATDVGTATVPPSAATVSPPASAPPATTPPPSTAPAAAATEVTYAGRVDGGAATVAIAVTGEQAVAYVCDGRQIEAWLQGTASTGTLALTGPDGASLTGTYGNGVAAGDVAAGGKAWTFTAPVAVAPAGLYRAASVVAGAQVVGGWIVLPDGRQVGVLKVDGQPEPAPPLEVATGRASVDGTAITAEQVDGGTLEREGTGS